MADAYTQERVRELDDANESTVFPCEKTRRLISTIYAETRRADFALECKSAAVEAWGIALADRDTLRGLLLKIDLKLEFNVTVSDREEISGWIDEATKGGE